MTGYDRIGWDIDKIRIITALHMWAQVRVDTHRLARHHRDGTQLEQGQFADLLVDKFECTQSRTR